MRFWSVSDVPYMQVGLLTSGDRAVRSQCSRNGWLAQHVTAKVASPRDGHPEMSDDVAAVIAG